MSLGGTTGTGTEFSAGVSDELIFEAAEFPAGLGPYRLARRPAVRKPGGRFFGAVFLLIVVLCLLAPVYASDIAHTGPNDNHITEVIKVGGKSETVTNAI